MAHKTMHITHAGVQNYRTRMMVGDPVRLSATDAKRLARIGWVEEPRASEPVLEPAADSPVSVSPTPSDAAPKKRRTRKRAAAKTSA